MRDVNFVVTPFHNKTVEGDLQMKRILALLLAVTCTLGTLCACGGATSGSSTAASDETSSFANDAHDNSITVGIAQDLDESLDPYSITAAGTREVLFNVYEGLVKADSTGNFNAAVAKDYDVSDDKLTYTFTLRDDVKFHNGDLVTVDDILYSFNTCAATAVETSLVEALSNIDSIAANEEDNTLVIKLKKASAEFLSYVAYVYIAPKDYQDGKTQPIGTGPFKFASRSIQENVVLEKNADYYGTPAQVDKVTYKIYEDETARMAALDAGSIDICAHLSVDNIKNLNDKYNVLEGNMNLVQALYLNNKVEPFTNEKVRQALCYAVDVQSILDLTEDGHGTKIGSAMYPAFSKYYDESLSDTYTFDQEKAKELLKEAGYENGFEFTIKVPSNYAPHVKTAEVLVEQLAAVGVTAKIQQVDWSTWLSDVYTNREYEATVVGFDASTLTASALLQRYTSTSDRNMFNYSNEEYDKVYAQADAATDDAEATKLYKQCEKILADTAASVYIQDLAEFVAIKKNLDGYNFYPMYVMDMSTIHYTN